MLTISDVGIVLLKKNKDLVLLSGVLILVICTFRYFQRRTFVTLSSEFNSLESRLYKIIEVLEYSCQFLKDIYGF